MKQTDFHVVVVDDKESSCRRIVERLSGLRVPSKTDEAIVVSVSKVHVSVERRNLHMSDRNRISGPSPREP
jgi:hypothetical protein